MTVLYLSYNGLLEPILPSQAVPYLRGLAQKGYRFVLVTFEKARDLRRTGRGGIMRIKEELASSGIEWRYLRYHKRPRMFSTLYDLLVGSFYALYLIMSRRCGIVHARGITPGSMTLFISKIVKTKILFDMRGLLAEEIAAGGGWSEGGAAYRFVKKAEQRLLKRADAVAVLTRRHLALNRELDVLKRRDIPMDVIPCCVDMRVFRRDEERLRSSRRQCGLDDAFVLMYQGKIGSFYFIDEMVDFFKALGGAARKPVFFVVTNDPVDPVMARARDRGIAPETVRSVSGAAFRDMPRHLEMADAGIFFINPRNKLGSSPIKMGEFLASGVPVVINPGVGDTEELVRDNRVGVVVKDFTDSAYREACEELFRLMGEGEALRARCRQTAERYLSLDDGIARYAALYEKISGAPR